MTANKVYLLNEDINKLVRSIANEIQKEVGHGTKFYIYGIPRGGIPVAYHLLKYFPHAEIANNLDDADIFVDDIIDSGATRRKYLKLRNIPFFALIHDLNKKPNTWYVFPWEQNNAGSAGDIPLRILQYIGENPERDGLKDTPKRVLKAWDFLFQGYKADPKKILAKSFENEENYDQMVVLKNIEFYSTCEHHLLPFFGKAHIAYIPKPPAEGGKVVGISKLARLVDCYAQRLQIQERLTQQISCAIHEEISALGVAVFIEAQHFCMISRGVQKQNSIMVTSSVKGVLEKEAARMEFLLLSQR